MPASLRNRDDHRARVRLRNRNPDRKRVHHLMGDGLREPCIGSGWCCMHANGCSARTYAAGGEPGTGRCPHVRWSDEKQRHLCGVILDAPTPEEKKKVGEFLSVGFGCCSLRDNPWRLVKPVDRTGERAPVADR